MMLQLMPFAAFGLVAALGFAVHWVGDKAVKTLEAERLSSANRVQLASAKEVVKLTTEANTAHLKRIGELEASIAAIPTNNAQEGECEATCVLRWRRDD